MLLYNGVATRRRHSLLTNSGKWTRFLEPVRADHQIVGGYLRDGALALLLQLRLLYMEPVGPGLQPLLWLGLTTLAALARARTPCIYRRRLDTPSDPS